MTSFAAARKLETALRAQILNPRTGKTRYTAHETLDAVINVAAAAIYNCADDYGRGLAALERQFVEMMHEQITGYDHDAEYHDEPEPDAPREEPSA
jgi:hypothetical protein